MKRPPKNAKALHLALALFFFKEYNNIIKKRVRFANRNK